MAVDIQIILIAFRKATAEPGSAGARDEVRGMPRMIVARATRDALDTAMPRV
jgi:hypothetical protein